MTPIKCGDSAVLGRKTLKTALRISVLKHPVCRMHRKISRMRMLLMYVYRLVVDYVAHQKCTCMSYIATYVYTTAFPG